MQRSKRWACLLAAVALGWVCYEAADAYAQEQLRKLMIDKLENAQKILEGIATADFDKTGRHAENLLALANRAEWLAYKTNRYELHSSEFRRAAETIVQRSRSKNLDGVTLAYMDLTMSCVRCHQYVREVRDARLPVPMDQAAFVPAGETR